MIGALERIAPRRLALDWDRERIGLSVGAPDAPVERVMVALDPTPEAVAEAVAARAGLLITHHPLIFRPLTAVRTDTPVGRVVAGAIVGGVALYAAHTNLDAVEGGVATVLAEALGLEEVELLDQYSADSLVKIVVFVPEAQAEEVRQALGESGAGHLGRYSHCTFATCGTGTFLPEAGAKPFLGKPGILERVAEARVETILPKSLLGATLKAVSRVHPYEEMAYDVYPLENPGPTVGLGRIGRLGAEMTLGELAERVKARLGTASVQYLGDTGRKVKKVAVCGGSAGELVPTAVFRGADVLVTGEIKYHDGLVARQEGLAVVAAGHDVTERPVVPVLARRLRGALAESRLAVEVLEAGPEGDLWQTR